MYEGGPRGQSTHRFPSQKGSQGDPKTQERLIATARSSMLGLLHAFRSPINEAFQVPRGLGYRSPQLPTNTLHAYSPDITCHKYPCFPRTTSLNWRLLDMQEVSTQPHIVVRTSAVEANHIFTAERTATNMPDHHSRNDTPMSDCRTFRVSITCVSFVAASARACCVVGKAIVCPCQNFPEHPDCPACRCNTP
jgi:hypothetical protein